MRNHSAVIVGIGTVCPIGVGFRQFKENLFAGYTEPAPPSRFPEYSDQLVAEVAGFNLKEHIDTIKSYIDATSAHALAACALARSHARWHLSGDQEFESGLALGSAWGCMDSNLLYAEKLVKSGPKIVPPLIFSHAYANAPNSIIAIEFNIKGFNVCFTGGHNAGMQALVYGLDQLRLGRCAFLLAGGTDTISRFILHGYAQKNLLATLSRPFHPGSPGFLLGEGACFLALERGNGKKDRGMARIDGAAMCTFDGTYNGFIHAMKAALIDANVAPERIGCIVASAPGLPRIDSAEKEAIQTVFHDPAPHILPLKAITGETMSASGPLGVAAAVACLQQGQVPELPIEGLGGEGKSPAHVTSSELRSPYVLVNSASLDGEVSSVVVTSLGENSL